MAHVYNCASPYVYYATSQPLCSDTEEHIRMNRDESVLVQREDFSVSKEPYLLLDTNSAAVNILGKFSWSVCTHLYGVHAWECNPQLIRLAYIFRRYR